MTNLNRLSNLIADFCLVFECLAELNLMKPNLRCLNLHINFIAEFFAPSGLNLADVLQKPSNFAADFWQNPHLENASKFATELFNTHKFWPRILQRIFTHNRSLETCSNINGVLSAKFTTFALFLASELL